MIRKKTNKMSAPATRSPPPCRFFNTPQGCKFSETECERPHVIHCKNGYCIARNTGHNHAADKCGCPGGPLFVQKKPVEAAPAVPLSVIIAKEKLAVCEKLYYIVEAELKETAKETSELTPVKTNAGKLVGMFRDGLTLSELNRMLTDSKFLGEYMAEAIVVLQNHEAAQAETK